MTEVRPASDQPPTDDAQRAALMLTTLGFAALPRVPADMAPVFEALDRRLDGWKGIVDLVTTMSRQGYDPLRQCRPLPRHSPRSPSLRELVDVRGGQLESLRQILGQTTSR